MEDEGSRDFPRTSALLTERHENVFQGAHEETKQHVTLHLSVKKSSSSRDQSPGLTIRRLSSGWPSSRCKDAPRDQTTSLPTSFKPACSPNISPGPVVTTCRDGIQRNLEERRVSFLMKWSCDSRSLGSPSVGVEILGERRMRKSHWFRS
jgi:hypothetical protein